MKILGQFAQRCGIGIDELLAEGAKERLILASGGVARDFLTIFGRAIDVAKERIERRDLARGTRIGGEDVNLAAGELGQFKEEEFTRDTGPEDRAQLQEAFTKIIRFCTEQSKANCILVEKDIGEEIKKPINELMDLKFLHRARSRVTVPARVGRLYDAFMLDLSRYTGSRARRNFQIVRFWGTRSAADALRRAGLIYLERE